MTEPSLGIDGLLFDPPAGFRHESTTATLRVGASGGRVEDGLATPVRPSLVVVRRRSDEADLAAGVARVQEELLGAIPGMRGIEAVDVRFADDAIGVVLAYSFPAPRKPDVILCQFQALRQDGEWLSTLTLSTTLAQLTPTRRDQFLRILASARLAS